MSHVLKTWTLPVVTIAALATVLAGCSGSADVSSPPTTPGATTSASAAPTPVASASGIAPTGSESGSGAGSGASGSGCAANSVTVPKDAAIRAVPDLDQDGKGDLLWLADAGSKRSVGVKTASGAVFSRAYVTASPISVTAYANRLSTASVILLDDGRQVLLFAVIGCQIVPSTNAQGKQYTFDEGFTGYGTGVGCPTIGSAPALVGFLATQQGSIYKITRTTVNLSDGGRSARNGTSTVVAAHEKSGTVLQKAATSVSCGPNNPGVAEKP